MRVFISILLLVIILAIQTAVHVISPGISLDKEYETKKAASDPNYLELKRGPSTSEQINQPIRIVV